MGLPPKDCEGCGKPFTPYRSTGRFCSTACRVKVNRRVDKGGTATVIPLGELGKLGSSLRPGESLTFDSKDVVAEDDGAGLKESHPLFGTWRSVRDTLTDADRLNTPTGQQALLLAETLANPHDTGSAKAAVSKELSRVLGEAMRGAFVEKSQLEILRERRANKLG